jgi:hypothetical protein
MAQGDKDDPRNCPKCGHFNGPLHQYDCTAGQETAMARITINGQTVEVGDGDINVTSRHGKIIVNGRTLAEGLSGTVDLKIEGAVAKVDADGSVQCGDVGGESANETGWLPQLESACEECAGAGGFFYVDDGRKAGLYCNACNGTGFVPTEAGKRLRDFLRHTFFRPTETAISADAGDDGA